MKATAFGLDLHSDVPLRLFEGSSAAPTGRTLKIEARGWRAAEQNWPETSELVCDERQANGDPIFSIRAHPNAGYLIAGPEYGRYLLSANGTRLQYPEKPDDAWERLLVAQVLPFAALLQGLEVFHASAVVRAGSAIAFLGPSRSGKTSLAVELCQRGASFLADDVVALQADAGRVLGHPGTPVAGIDRGGVALAHEPKPLVVNQRERLVQMHGAVEPAPLSALFFLDRRTDGPPSPRFEPLMDARILLAATFNFVLATPARLRGLLEVCSLAARVPVEQIAIGPSTDTSELAAAVEHRLRGSQ